MTQRFIKTREVPQRVLNDNKEEIIVMVPVGYVIGPGKKTILRRRDGHFGKSEEYYKRANTPKALRKIAT
jgi:hypothetical protein